MVSTAIDHINSEGVFSLQLCPSAVVLSFWKSLLNGQFRLGNAADYSEGVGSGFGFGFGVRVRSLVRGAALPVEQNTVLKSLVMPGA